MTVLNLHVGCTYVSAYEWALSKGFASIILGCSTKEIYGCLTSKSGYFFSLKNFIEIARINDESCEVIYHLPTDVDLKYCFGITRVKNK